MIKTKPIEAEHATPVSHTESRAIEDSDKRQQIRQAQEGLAHELRTPITAIRECLALLREGITGPLNATQFDLVNTSYECCEQLADLIDDFFDSPGTDFAQMNLQMEPLDLADVADQAMRFLDSQRQHRGHLWTLECEPNLPAVAGDAHRLLQIFLNIIGNAIKFTAPRGRIDITMHTNPGHDHVITAIRDSGCGIPQADLARVFQRGFRGKNRTGDSMGLGLYLCDGIIGAHRGRLWVESAPGVGSTFFISLPCAMPI